MPRRVLVVALAITSLSFFAPRVDADPIISPGTPTTTVPTYLSDGSYLFGITVPDPLPAGEFLEPVDISGAVNLQFWQFTLLFDNTVVNEVDPLDGTSGIYGAEFTDGDLNSLAFILGGFPFNALGEVDTVAGSYPSLLTGPSGDGTLAFILFQCLDTENCSNPGFSISGTQVVQGAPEPATLVLLASGLALLGGRRLLRREQRG
jgi:PEP-CTERM motif-containing protein